MEQNSSEADSSVSTSCECHIIMQIQSTKDLNPGRFELGVRSYNSELAE